MLAKKKNIAPPVTSTVTVSLDISFTCAPGSAPLSRDEIQELTARAVESFTTVGRERIAAFNEISRVRRGAQAEVIAVEAHPCEGQSFRFAGVPAND
ncbi:hypothetical protein C8N35_11467 [Breoghania corrubedonensis]|uniref:Uncharacterized protein n=1 Tax=Breoghania corrubedonensis TaxID=665038 RepID=A0A2T5USB3_9HYPH|nr:hypothetical protein [Breoghania corrubedonensis]PTW54386.1 hypothetical protein C8N35_11467 [Breoghania corrubedonensis]